MKNSGFIILLIFISKFIFSQSILEVDGGIQVSDYEMVPQEGTIRYNSTLKNFEGWNGSRWVSLTGSKDGTTGILHDQSGNSYTSVVVGDQVWMAESLRTTLYADGDTIKFINNGSMTYVGTTDPLWEQTNINEEGAYCYYFDNPNLGSQYGLLYNWYAVDDIRGLCPDGWRIPSDTDWTELIDYLDPGSVNPNIIGAQSLISGGKMKSIKSDWSVIAPNIGATNESSMSFLPTGYREDNGTFKFLWERTSLWSSSERTDSTAYNRSLFRDVPNIRRDSAKKGYGYPVRCIKN